MAKARGKEKERGKQKHWIWYVEVNGHTNEQIATQLDSDKALRADVLCADGERRNLWECRYLFVSKLLEDQQSCHFRVDVFRAAARSDRPQRWAPDKRGRAVRAIRRSVAKKRRATAGVQQRA